MNEAKKVVEAWFEKVGEEFTSDNVGELFSGYLLPEFINIVPEAISEYPDYVTKKTDPEYDLKLEAYSVESKSLQDLRKKLLAESGYKFIESEGGGEGEGEYCYGVIKLDNKYYKAEWSYYSYQGCNYDDIKYTICEVAPVEKTITVYERV